jgi:hypothetical protein
MKRAQNRFLVGMQWVCKCLSGCGLAIFFEFVTGFWRGRDAVPAVHVQFKFG